MKILVKPLIFCTVAILLLPGIRLTTGQPQTGRAENSIDKNSLLLRDFKPRTMLHLTEHQVTRARFPVIDVHNHVNDARSGGRGHQDPASLVQLMDHLNIQTIVILTGQWDESLQRIVDEMVKPYPGRFMVFTQIDWSKIDDPDFSQEMVRQIDDAVRRGARGLKVLKDFGLEVRYKSGKLVAVDDPRLDPIWEECGRLGIPVSIHVSDPEAFFQPVDGRNERYEELLAHPDWSFYGPKFPTKQAILDARDRMFARHPNTTFISLHVANWPENLDYVSSLLDRLPNVMVEFGAREAELGRQPRRAMKFFTDYQDRIMFGTDATPGAVMYQNYFRWLETADEYFDYWGAPGQGRWKIYGMELPDPILEKVYHLNAERIFKQFKGVPPANAGGN
ncbi:MAG TPA: amidohydrolase family protein [Terriglobia bacterium]|nr:amidohydrolase family protein [Terriglobia bacterium]